MNMIVEIKKEDVMQTAIIMLKSARHSVKVTMDAQEELDNPLSSEYIKLLEAKLEEGISIQRVGFGSADDFSKLPCVHYENKNYRFSRTNRTDYRRMIMVDEEKMMFVKQSDGELHIYYSEDPEILSTYLSYFNNHELLHIPRDSS